MPRWAISPNPSPSAYREHHLLEGVNRARSGDNLGFAISPEIVTRVVPSLIADGTYHHSYLDVRTIDVSPAVAVTVLRNRVESS